MSSSSLSDEEPDDPPEWPHDGAGLGAGLGEAQLGGDAAPRGALEQAELEQVRLVDVLQRVRLLADRDRQR